MAAPASSHDAVNHTTLGDQATPSMASAARAEPAVIRPCGPDRSIARPTATPSNAEITRAAENAAARVAAGQPVSLAIVPDSTGKAVVHNPPADDLGNAERAQHLAQPNLFRGGGLGAGHRREAAPTSSMSWGPTAVGPQQPPADSVG